MSIYEDEQSTIDAAKRMMDCVNMHVAARIASNADKPQFVAIRLDDGRSPDNNTLYDERKDVFRFNKARNIMAVKIGIDSMSFREAMIVMQMNRRAYVNGIIFSEEAPVTPHLSELLRPFIPNTLDRLG